MASPSHKNDTLETVKTLFFAFVFALIFRSFAFEPFHIPSGSMKSNLLIGDYIFISKYSYGYSKYSFPLGIIPMHGRIMASKPERGDIVVFRPPGRPTEDFIKRLIGLPGDHIQMKQGQLYLNGNPVKRTYVDDWTDEDVPVADGVLRRYRETLPEGKSYLTLYNPSFDSAELSPNEQEYQANNTKEYIIPEGHYFMMGDNRDNSQDSRFAYPVSFVPEENLVGRAEIILFSWSCGYPFCPGRFLMGLH